MGCTASIQQEENEVPSKTNTTRSVVVNDKNKNNNSNNNNEKKSDEATDSAAVVPSSQKEEQKQQEKKEEEKVIQDDEPSQKQEEEIKEEEAETQKEENEAPKQEENQQEEKHEEKHEEKEEQKQQEEDDNEEEDDEDDLLEKQLESLTKSKYHLKFEDMPNNATLGETYNAAILFVNEDEEPIAEADGLTLKVTVHPSTSSEDPKKFKKEVKQWISDGGISGLSDSIEMSCGESIVELVLHKPAPTSSLMFRAIVNTNSNSNNNSILENSIPDYEPNTLIIPARATITGVPSASEGGEFVEDELLSDITHIIERLRSAHELSTSENVNTKVRHYLALIKGRAWNAEGNSQRMLDTKLLPLIIDIIQAAPSSGGASVEAVLEALNVVEEILINTKATVMPSCSACRALIRPDNTSELLTGGTRFGIYHASCLRCRSCHESLRTDPFIRSEGDAAPYHVECAKKDEIKSADFDAPLQCTIVPPFIGSTDNHVAASDFWNNDQHEKLGDILVEKWLTNEYVKERATRVSNHVHKAWNTEKSAKFVEKVQIV